MIAVIGYLSIDDLEIGGVHHANIPGGVTYTALGALRAGAKVAMVATAGSDYPFGWLDGLKGEGVDITRVRRSAHASRRAALRHFADGRRDSISYGRSEWWEATLALQPPAIEDNFELKAIGVSPMLAEAAARLVDRAPAVMDTSEFFAAREGPALLRVMQNAEIVVPSQEETRLLFPGLSDDEALRTLHEHTGRTVIQKRGAQGLLLMSSRHPDGLREPALTTNIADPTGAGDAVVGAVAAGLEQELSDEELLKLAVRIAAQAVADIGPRGLGFAA